jgi:hypothetical protein
MPEVDLDIEDVVQVPDVPDASYPELAGADVGSLPDVPAVPDAVDEVAPETVDDVAVQPPELSGDADDAAGG